MWQRNCFNFIQQVTSLGPLLSHQQHKMTRLSSNFLRKGDASISQCNVFVCTILLTYRDNNGEFMLILTRQLEKKCPCLVIDFQLPRNLLHAQPEALGLSSLWMIQGTRQQLDFPARKEVEDSIQHWARTEPGTLGHFAALSFLPRTSFCCMSLLLHDNAMQWSQSVTDGGRSEDRYWASTHAYVTTMAVTVSRRCCIYNKLGRTHWKCAVVMVSVCVCVCVSVHTVLFPYLLVLVAVLLQKVTCTHVQ